MKKLAAFFQLIRWPNLVFILLTQALFYWAVYLPLFRQQQTGRLLLLMVASVFIAAAGYIINDYFDLDIDRVNKPQKNMIGVAIHRRWAIIWHLSLSAVGILLTALAARSTYWYLIPANLGCVLLLWFYSTSLKKTLLIGNVLISLLTAWTILILFFAFSSPVNAFRTSDPASVKFFRLAFLYAGFAFIISLIREAVKDVEDMDGDQRYGCRTLPIIAGVRSTKIYAGTWIAVLLAALIILQFYVLQFGWWPSVMYTISLVILPLVMLLMQLRKANTSLDFARLSAITKWIMLAGIVSMSIFRFYF